MPAKDRPPSFQFYPREYLSSRAVSAMHPTARGGYVHLLCHAWLSDRPGWLPDDDKLLAALSGLGERWQEHRETIAKAWRIRKGWWVQIRMVESRHAQHRYFLAKSRSGKAGNKARWHQEDKSHRDDSRVANDRSASDSSSSSEKIEPRINTLSSADADFDRFWQEYPRKVGKAEALKLWHKHRPSLSAVLESLGKWKSSRRWQDGFVMDGDRWVRGKRWDDEPEGDEKNNGGGTAAATVAAFLKGESNAQG